MVKQGRQKSGLGRFGDPGSLILLSLADGPKHGHAMITDIRDHLGMTLGPGTLYGAISRLVDLGLIVALPTDDRRQPYELTGSGRAAVADQVATWDTAAALGRLRLAR